ncbi:hypothetical protein H9W90_11085 [Polaribacter pectinis]|uniref:Secreted protein n=1 Tax=Polaribacter pectinis TaxID=2738844 RepID=A0A7G9L7Y9_9FLAO|nr:hypothetical protein [Polaribacter pectinis]QNM84738.1 hypothetical protein H9W90_11085 [Polaribacter pectinis]
MKQVSTKIASTLLAFLVLFSTFSFTVEKHYCGDFLVDVSFVGEANSCAMEMDAAAKTIKKKCCKDEVHKIEGQDELQHNSIDKLDFQKKQFLTAFFVSYKNLFIEIDTKTNFYKDFSPPDIPLDYQVLYQSFLI